jgi:predicted outer membrane protein
MRSSSNDILKKVNTRIGKNITSQDIQKVAKQVNATTLKNEQQLRDLVKSVGEMAGMKVPTKITDDIVNSLQGGAINPSQMDKMLKQVMGPK